MAIAWPVTLQQLLNRDSFDLQMPDTVLKTDMDVGAPKRRRRYTKAIRNMSCSIWVTPSQYTILENFFLTTLNGGITNFEFNHPITGILTEYKMSPPKVGYIGGETFNVTMNWEQQI